VERLKIPLNYMENFSLTPEERAVAFDAVWIYRKNSVMAKVMELMGRLHRELAADAASAVFSFPENCLQLGAKISKGERYKELPYVILDYPRYFSRDNIFAFRTMFWWGHYFSCTLHLSGGVKTQYTQALAAGHALLAAHHFQAYVPDDPWQHDFGDGNYREVAAFTAGEWSAFVEERGFIKLAKPFELEMWEKIIPGVVSAYAVLLAVLGR
jgi:hypothetical protein